MDHDDVLVQVELALSIAKRVERESKIAKQTLARLRDELQADKATSSEQLQPRRHKHNERAGSDEAH